MNKLTFGQYLILGLAVLNVAVMALSMDGEIPGWIAANAMTLAIGSAVMSHIDEINNKP